QSSPAAGGFVAVLGPGRGRRGPDFATLDPDAQREHAAAAARRGELDVGPRRPHRRDPNGRWARAGPSARAAIVFCAYQQACVVQAAHARAVIAAAGGPTDTLTDPERLAVRDHAWANNLLMHAVADAPVPLTAQQARDAVARAGRSKVADALA